MTSEVPMTSAVLAADSAWPPPPPAPALAEGDQRGTVTIQPRVVERIAERTVRDTGAGADASARVPRLADTIALDLQVTLPYPDGPLADAIEPVRRAVVDRVHQLVGRPVARLDMEVRAFALAPPTPRRRVR